MAHTLIQLQRGVLDFCEVVDQAAIGFMWNWVLMPKAVSARVKQDETVAKIEDALEVVRNATIESSLISIRILDEFFAPSGARPGDIRAFHYIGYSSPGRFLTTAEFDVIGRRIAHLTIDRAQEGSNYAWQITDLIRRAYAPCAHFLSFVVEGAGSIYLPPSPFNATSRLQMCRQMDQTMQNVLRRSKTEEQHPAARVRFENEDLNERQGNAV